MEPPGKLQAGADHGDARRGTDGVTFVPSCVVGGERPLLALIRDTRNGTAQRISAALLEVVQLSCNGKLEAHGAGRAWKREIYVNKLRAL